jgi:hypothetical protein
MNPILLLLLIIGITFVATAFVKARVRCPPPKIIYRYIPKNTLDVQFGEDNNPSDIYKDMFLNSNPWIGGYTLGDKKTTLNELKDNKPAEIKK